MKSIAIRFDPNVGGFLKRKKRLREFIDTAGTESYVYERFADGDTKLSRVQRASEVGKLHSKGARARMLVQVAIADFEGALLYAGLKDRSGTEVGLELRGTWRVSDCREFLNGYALTRLSSSVAVSPLDLERELIETFRTEINDAIRAQGYDDLESRDTLPKSWWKTKLLQWEGIGGIELVKVGKVVFESATAERRNELEKQRELNELDAAKDSQEKEHELGRQERAAEVEEKKAELEANRELSDEKREHRLRELRHEAERKDLEAQEELERRRLEFEKEKAKRESELYRIRNQLPEAEEILEEARRREARVEEMLQKMHEAIADLTWCAAGGVLSPWALELLERANPHNRLSQIFRENEAEYDAIDLKMVSLRTRDIGTRSAETLSKGDGLNLEFVSRFPGYATVINIGTSAKVFLHSPNVYVGAEGCKIEADCKYEVPRDLLPGLEENGLNYIESGPPGWEEMVVIVSEEPLALAEDIVESKSGNPFVRISAEEWVERMAGLSPDSWRSGTLGFKVLAS